MAPIVLLNAFAYVGGYDLTGDSNQLALGGDAAKVERTTFRSGGWEESVMGMRTMELELNGFASFGLDEGDQQQFNNLGVTQVSTVGPTETEGQPTFMSQAGVYQYTAYGTLGENAPYTVTGHGKDAVGIVRGVLAKAKGTVSATGALGSSQNLGNVAAGKYLYGTFHVLSAGTTITAVLESDDNGAFSSATTRATVGPLTTTGGTWVTRVAGPLTETHYRWRVTAITGTFTAAAAIGIQ